MNHRNFSIHTSFALALLISLSGNADAAKGPRILKRDRTVRTHIIPPQASRTSFLANKFFPKRIIDIRNGKQEGQISSLIQKAMQEGRKTIIQSDFGIYKVNQNMGRTIEFTANDNKPETMDEAIELLDNGYDIIRNSKTRLDTHGSLHTNRDSIRMFMGRAEYDGGVKVVTLDGGKNLELSHYSIGGLAGRIAQKYQDVTIRIRFSREVYEIVANRGQLSKIKSFGLETSHSSAYESMKRGKKIIKKYFEAAIQTRNE